MSDALPRLRLSTQRGSAYDGEPSGSRMSQNILATPGYSPRHGSNWNVEGSGRAIMSDSCTRAKPSMALPSKPMPSANAPSSSAGATATDLRAPSTSVNQSRTNLMSRSSSVRSTNSSCLSTTFTLDVAATGSTLDATVAPRHQWRRFVPVTFQGQAVTAFRPPLAVTG